MLVTMMMANKAVGGNITDRALLKFYKNGF